MLVRSLLRDSKATLDAVINRLDVRLTQIESILKTEHSIIPPPPERLQLRVLERYANEFIESGYNDYAVMKNLMFETSVSLSHCRKILDFGCGCGRVIRALRRHLPSQALYGTDVDPEAIAWLKKNCGAMAEFDVNPHMPPMNYPTGAFDFIYSIGIFSHLPEDMQLAWLEELHRIAEPGAYLFLTIRGSHQRNLLGQKERAEFDAKGFYYAASTQAVEGLPVFYQPTWHSHGYIRSVWSKFFAIISIREHVICGEDAIILMK
jgi:SAM-dependent methyltransferase